MRTFLVAFALALPAAAADITVIHAGRLLDGSDQPVNTATPLNLAIGIYASPVPLPDEQPLWHDTYPAPVTNGMYQVELGKGGNDNQKLSTALFAPGAARFLQVAVAGQVMLPRMKFGLAPVAGLALDLSCAGCVVTEKLADKTVTGDKLAPAAVAFAHLAADAVGTTATSVARGDHLHAGVYLPVGDQLSCPTGQKATGLDAATGNVVCAIDLDTLFTSADAVAAMGAKANANPLNHDRYTDGEAMAAMGAKANANPLDHDRYTDAEATAAMGAKANANPLDHDRYTNGEAVAAMGAKANANPLDHDRYTDAEATGASGSDLARAAQLDDAAMWSDVPETVLDVMPDGREASVHRSVEAGTGCYNWATTKMFPINPNRTYRAGVWVRATEPDLSNYFGFYVYDASGNPIAGAWGNPYFKTNSADPNVYRQWTGYLLPSNVTDANADGVADRQSAITTGNDWRMPANAAFAVLRFGSCYGNGSNTGFSYFAYPSIREVHNEDALTNQWIAASFAGGWHNYGGGYNPAGYYMDQDGVVHLRGLVAGGTGVIFTLPGEMRPPYQELRAVQTNPNTIGRLDITASGIVAMTTGDTGWISLDGISFRAAGN